MAEVFTSYSVDNDNRFKNALAKASQVSQDLRVPFGLILADFYKSEQSIWSLKGPGQYPPFKGSAGSYRQVKYQTATGRNASKRSFVTDDKSPYQKEKIRKYGFDYPLLVATGALANSLSGPNNAGSIAQIGKLSLVFGTSIKYGIYHQSDAPRNKLPLRKFLFIGPEAPTFATSDQQGRLERWNGILQDFINSSIARSGLQPGS